MISGQTGTDGECEAGDIQVFDCGPNGLCYDGDDIEIATVSVVRQPDGQLLITLLEPLTVGQKIYVRDNCFDPPLVGPPTVVYAMPTAPLLSPPAALLLVVVMSGVGLLGLWRRPRRT